MKITNIITQTFRYTSNTIRDSEGHGHPGPEHEATQTVLRIGMTADRHCCDDRHCDAQAYGTVGC